MSDEVEQLSKQLVALRKRLSTAKHLARYQEARIYTLKRFVKALDPTGDLCRPRMSARFTRRLIRGEAMDEAFELAAKEADGWSEIVANRIRALAVTTGWREHTGRDFHDNSVAPLVRVEEPTCPAVSIMTLTDGTPVTCSLLPDHKGPHLHALAKVDHLAWTR
jgi:hypothetical protein